MVKGRRSQGVLLSEIVFFQVNSELTQRTRDFAQHNQELVHHAEHGSAITATAMTTNTMAEQERIGGIGAVVETVRLDAVVKHGPLQDKSLLLYQHYKLEKRTNTDRPGDADVGEPARTEEVKHEPIQIRSLSLDLDSDSDMDISWDYGVRGNHGSDNFNDSQS
ncbi:hypothetical protein BGZ95_000435 [Linnemannia exigua]|uniref:Uncharacterized protein n=1 Tax=Linnemannia exigua TaxID=604196 RepID=A0AAD4DJD9_9FUNG|nr:hypothetical protein BGZ95_000435 [Linnemannia exigua]